MLNTTGAKATKTTTIKQAVAAPAVAADVSVADVAQPQVKTQAEINRELAATSSIQIVREDPYLAPFEPVIKHRIAELGHLKNRIENLEKVNGGLKEFVRSFKRYGFTRRPDGILYREWAPAAQNMWLIGDFNNWNRTSHPCEKKDFGIFEIFLKDPAPGVSAIQHSSKIKVAVQLPNGNIEDRIPTWINRVGQLPRNPTFDGLYWNPSEEYKWKIPEICSLEHPKDGLRIYEAHVGMATPEAKIGTYVEFRETVLPNVAKLGYNAIQLMAVMEHAYYASFGYQVTNFFAVSSRFGTPEELKELIDEAHRLGIRVLLDVVHSHASKNVADGLNNFDGSGVQYFHEGERGTHSMWDSRLFNYGHHEVLRFLLSNLIWYVEEYHFDGFRFDGVTSMLYHHHGTSHAFVNGYEEYYGGHVENDALYYLTLANDILHQDYPNIITIAEDVSGYPGLCRKPEEGGVGFDYRLAMSIPDTWIKLLKSVQDDHWRMGDIIYALSNRRYKEKTIAYAESHDQALVGDKTIAFWLMDKEMYTGMSILTAPSPIIHRGISLHKLIRLITYGLGGEGYLNFMGNEFGHPEWIDFPREGNGHSHHYSRRRFDLAEDPLLRYQHLKNLDIAMNKLNTSYNILESNPGFVSVCNESKKIIVFERNNLVFVFNFHPTESYNSFRFGVREDAKYKIVLDSDKIHFGGLGLIDDAHVYETEAVPTDGYPYSFQIYIPSRVAFVLTRVDKIV
eukprot:TRINITY_DN3425_c0_g1_i1.p1 TRINITY_DN3425_c0_g1~~TRINITY_DN3425_c0_g1_i1.p1  ORF type:complete len:734 (-),score=212.92 TRINITY_DN3425_c0_g1_i1:111-2312(-)